MATTTPTKSGNDPLLSGEESRPSVTKEQWKDFLERVVREEDERMSDEEYSAPLEDSADPLPTASMGASTTAAMNMDAGTVVTATELTELNRDLDVTADNLTDLEIEFAEEFKNMQVGLSSAFAEWNTSQQDLLTANSNHMANGQLITDESIRSEFGISLRSTDIGTSIRSIRQHARRMNNLKRDMELSFLQSLKQQENSSPYLARRTSEASGVSVVEFEDKATASSGEKHKPNEERTVVEEEKVTSNEEAATAPEESPTSDDKETNTPQETGTPSDTAAKTKPSEEGTIIIHDDQAKLSVWFGKIWSAIETLLAKRRAHRLAKQLARQQARDEESQFRDRTTWKSFWRLFLQPAHTQATTAVPARDSPLTSVEDSTKKVVEIID